MASLRFFKKIYIGSLTFLFVAFGATGCVSALSEDASSARLNTVSTADSAIVSEAIPGKSEPGTVSASSFSLDSLGSQDPVDAGVDTQVGTDDTQGEVAYAIGKYSTASVTSSGTDSVEDESGDATDPDTETDKAKSGSSDRETQNAASGEESEAVIYIKQETGQETESVIRMGVDSALLPILEGVTTAYDNSVLAPVNLQLGDEYSVVEVLQARLMDLGYMDFDETTSYYGTSTAQAVQMFQRQMDMTQDGVCGAETWDALFEASAPHYAVGLDDEGDDILRIQERLYELGYLSSDDVDGYFGPATEEAVKNMQERNGISVDGTVGVESTNLLYSEEVQANVLGKGDESELVSTYQQKLIELGYLRNEEADGNFGGATETAVRDFQSRNDLVVDGYLGPGTIAVLMSDDAQPFGLRVGDESDTVLTVQQRLAHYGYLSSRHVTGYYGSITEAAVEQFQGQNGLTVDGVVGTQTLAALESDNAKSKPASLPSASTGSGNTDSGSSSDSGGSTAGSGSSGSTALVGSGGTTVSGSASALVSIAMSKLGCPYVYGAKGPNSFDCSGFVYWCLNQAGVRQSYLTSSGWRNPGRYQRIDSYDSLQAGDIIVVSGHVGICAGGGTVVDASSSNGRVVHRQLGNWWRNNFIVGWRIFG